MEYSKTRAVDKILEMKRRVRILQGGSCFIAGTPVLMADGSKVPIEQVKKGDSVLSLSNNHEILGSEVYDLWENAPNKPIISFSVGTETIRATYDHKFYTPEGYKELYRVVWGAMDSSQRIQLQLLCKQYGATFDLDPSWREDASYNEASDNGKEQSGQAISNPQNSTRRENHARPSGSSKGVGIESFESGTGRPSERKHSGQPCTEPGVGDSRGEHPPGLCNGVDGPQAGGIEWESTTQRPASSGDAFRVERTPSVQSERAGKEVWGVGGLCKRHSGKQELRSFAPQHIQIQIPERTYAISVSEENYFVGENEVNVSNSAGKTIAVLLIFIDRCQNEPGKLFSVVSETLPHLKKGAIRDFLNIMEGHGYYRDEAWNRTDFIYTFENGTKLEFFSADSPDKVRGPRRNVLFINEANNISYETYTQLAIRTSEEVYIDYNPVAEFWVHDDVMVPGNDNYDFLILTYKDNDALPESVVKELESRRNKPDWWRVYGEGQIGGQEGRVYTGWKQIDEIPQGAKLERYALDFGYTNDPSALIGIWYFDQGYIFDEILFQKGLSNKQIADTILAQEFKALTVADAAEPKSIDEIRSYGVNIVPAVKGQGSIKQGIQLVQEQNISVTKRSTNLLKESRNYLWEKDVNDKPTGDPIGIWNHAMDAIRYGMTSIVPLKMRMEQMLRMPPRQKKTRVNPAR